MSDSSENSEAAEKPGEFKIEFDSKSGKGFQDGMEALQKVFGGFVQSIKDAVGPEMMQNLQAAQWLEQLATCLDQIAAGLRDAGAVPAEAAGQLAFYVEQWETGLEGSKLESSQAALRGRLELAERAIQQVTAENAAQQAAVVAQAAGYFRAAGKSVLPLPTGGEEAK